MIDPDIVSWSDLDVTVVPFNVDGIDAVPLVSGQINNFAFRNINESNLSCFVRFEIWHGAECLRAFLVKVDVVGIPDSRVSSILKGIINSRDRFFEYLRFLLADDSEKEEIGGGEKKPGNGDGQDSIWNLNTPIFEQLLLAASRSPHRLRAIDDVVKRLCEEGAESNERIVPDEFVEFWEAFKALVPQMTQRVR